MQFEVEGIKSGDFAEKIKAMLGEPYMNYGNTYTYKYDIPDYGTLGLDNSVELEIGYDNNKKVNSAAIRVPYKYILKLKDMGY